MARSSKASVCQTIHESYIGTASKQKVSRVQLLGYIPCIERTSWPVGGFLAANILKTSRPGV